MTCYAAPLHSCKYRWLHAPATNIADSRCARPTAGGCQHLPEIPDNLQETGAVSGLPEHLFQHPACVPPKPSPADRLAVPYSTDHSTY